MPRLGGPSIPRGERVPRGGLGRGRHLVDGLEARWTANVDPSLLLGPAVERLE